MSLLTYYLEYGSHLGRLRRRRRRCRRRRRAYAPTSNTASHDNHEKIHSWVTFSFLYEYGAPLGGLSGRQSSAMSFKDNFEMWIIGKENHMLKIRFQHSLHLFLVSMRFCFCFCSAAFSNNDAF